MDTTDAIRYELRFASLFQEGRALSFPCDAHGKVALEALSPVARGNLQRAQREVGREWAAPAVRRAWRSAH